VTVVGSNFSESLLSRLREMPEVESIELKEDRLIFRLKGLAKSAPLVKRIVMEGGEVEEVKKGKASLEEVFLLLMQENSK